LALGLVSDRGPKGWRTTQEAAWALLALDAYRRANDATGADMTTSVSIGGRRLLEASLKGGAAEQNARLPMTALTSGSREGLIFSMQGQGQLHYQARLRYAPIVLPTVGEQAGIEVSKKCYAQGDTSESLSFSVGQWVRCDIEVITPSPRRFLVIDDP